MYIFHDELLSFVCWVVSHPPRVYAPETIRKKERFFTLFVDKYNFFGRQAAAYKYSIHCIYVVTMQRNLPNIFPRNIIFCHTILTTSMKKNLCCLYMVFHCYSPSTYANYFTSLKDNPQLTPPPLSHNIFILVAG